MSHDSLVRRAQTDSNAFGELYELHVDEVYRYLFFKVKDADLADDLTSQIWEKVLQHLSGFNEEHPKAFRAWLFRIARNALLDHLRLKSSQNEPLEWHEHLCGEGENFAQWLDLKDFNDDFLKVLPELSPRERDLVELKYLVELRNQEIAELTKLSEKSVSSYLSRALKKLQHLLELHRS